MYAKFEIDFILGKNLNIKIITNFEFNCESI